MKKFYNLGALSDSKQFESVPEIFFLNFIKSADDKNYWPARFHILEGFLSLYFFLSLYSATPPREDYVLRQVQ